MIATEGLRGLDLARSLHPEQALDHGRKDIGRAIEQLLQLMERG